MVIKEHQNLQNGNQPVALQDGQAADVGQFFSPEPGKWLSLLDLECFPECEKSHLGTEKNSLIV